MDSSETNKSERILVLVPTGTDGANTLHVLRQAGLHGELCPNLDFLSMQLREGAGALLIAEEGLSSEQLGCFQQALARQPAWSDIPLLLVTSSSENAQAGQQLLNCFHPHGNVTLVERPLRAVSLISVLRAALRARRRQYQVRDLVEEQRLVLTSIREAMVTIDYNWRYTYVSDRAAEIAGLPREKLIGQNCWELFPNPDKNFYTALHRTMNERVPQVVEHRSSAGDLWFESRAYPSAKGISVFTTEISERKRAEAALKESKDELEKRVQERTAKLQETISELEAFSYSVSHDLRAPLRAMQGYSQVLLEDCAHLLDEPGKDYVQKIGKAAMRLDKLIQDILTYSRVARAQIESKSIQLEPLILDVIQSYSALREAKIEIQRPLADVMGHEGSLVQCISNLLGNAVKFVRDNQKPEVQIWTEAQNGKVTLFFKDNGIGIAPEYQAGIFNMFAQAHFSQKYEGTGIGLAIVRKAAERMGGEVGVKSKVGEGSTFWLRLPRS
jgi:PAS domain S-box-containing protein